MKHLYKLLTAAFALALLMPLSLMAQQEVMVRDLHTYDVALTDQSEIGSHPLLGVEVTFDAVVVSYPKNSGLASLVDGEPGRIHLFVTDVNAIAEGEEGMTIQFVVEGDQRKTLETLRRGDVIRAIGSTSVFGGGNTQFSATFVEQIGSIEDEEYADLAELLEPEVITLSDINIPSTEAEGKYKWNAENYSKYIHRYVKIENLEVIDRVILDGGRPWFVLTDGTSILTSNDTSLRFRNDRENYAYNAETEEGLGYNWRRIKEGHDEPFTPPAPGSIVDVSGYIVFNTFDPAGFDETATQSTLKIAPWDDGVVWTADGNDPTFRTEPEGWPNDFVVKGYAPIIDNPTLSPDSGIVATDKVLLSANILRPEEDYTINSVKLSFSSYPYTEDSGDTTTVDMENTSGDTYTYEFDAMDEFTIVNYTITAEAETADGVVTTARYSGTYQVISEDQVSPVTFSPAAGAYTNSVTVALATTTPGAKIHYTTNGDDPTAESTVYSSPLNFTENVTIKAIAVLDGMDDSPIVSRTYQVNVAATVVNTLAELSSGQVGTTYQYTGDAVVTFKVANRNQKWLMDDSGAILIDDSQGIITSEYEIGDVMSGLLGTLGNYNGLPQFVPLTDPGASTGTAEIEPVEITLAELDDSHISMLVKITDVSFAADGNFAGGTNYDITDPSLEDGETVLFRTAFSAADYIGEAIPTDPIEMIALVGYFNDFQLTARNAADLGMTTSLEPGDQPFTFALEQNYPNPFNPTTNITFSVAEMANVNLVVYDILGRKVATLVNEVHAPGSYLINFNASHLSSGAYFYRLEAGKFVSIKKMMLIK